MVLAEVIPRFTIKIRSNINVLINKLIKASYKLAE